MKFFLKRDMKLSILHMIRKYEEDWVVFEGKARGGHY